MLVTQYESFGDIKLGFCDDYEKELLYKFIENHKNSYIKKTELDEYYLCVPICIGSYLDDNDPNIYVDHLICNHHFYFVDLYAPENVAFIKFDEKNSEFISNIDIEGCLEKESFFNENQYEKVLYEILPSKEELEDEEDKIKYIKELLFQK